MAMIFQEPGTALNPLVPIQRQLEETFQLHRLDVNHSSILSSWTVSASVIPKRVLKAYPTS